MLSLVRAVRRLLEVGRLRIKEQAGKKIALCGYPLAENIVAHLHAVVVDAQCVVVSIEHAYENTVQREMNE